ncbi:hypothetical protein P12x_000647 [Tundrisphaera lichenicola]|uniref:hypothetical protein n=1 Tax=Tundrisphaera lichenicola TaxID=2029860 RepID=UPI003EBD9A80
MTTEPKTRRSGAWAVVCLFLGGCWGPPQIGVDREAFQTVDALYTAVSLRDPRLVEDCRGRLVKLREADKLPEPASKDLEAIIEETRGGEWEPAQLRLSRFMEGQRR